MNTIQIQTTQNVFIEYQPAGVGDRLLAGIIDRLIQIAYVFILLFIIGAATNIVSINSYLEKFDIISILILLLFLPVMFYTLILEIVMDGQTIGKRALNIKVVRLDGTQPTIGNYLIRWLLRLIDVYFPCNIGLVAIITISTSAQGQRLGDMAAGTTVITMKRRVTLAQTRLPEVDSNYQPLYPQVIRLSDRDIEIIRETLQTYHRNGNDPYLLSSLAAKLQTLLDVQTAQSNLEFLQTILKDYTYLTSQQ
ncbi:RDD family protein [Cytophagaceae bacterium DM2B3-1]|uniref:RDD family protein n=1 Tax=Xanthocytophaga flava TaxID=3048013 RepID=A0AAE3U4W2_9BACT|nr:RDD family protein [Xanthocytophaga flavus]MDJ1468800.1 RDD family protein [Xanthocytophaga flavus]MDJ1480104.1 RDD family protein [Xanthocytophaga flavus]MDJ1495660.1 RDD family protein [Xanthocytophaga flavus]